MSQLSLLISLRRAQETPTWRARNADPKLPATIYPFATEEVYQKELTSVFTVFVDDVLDALPTLLPYLSDTTTLNSRLVYLGVEKRKKIDEMMLSAFLASLLMGTGNKVTAVATASFAKQLEVLIGSIYAPGADLSGILESWATVNKNLIGNLAHEYLNNFNKLLMRAAQGSWELSKYQEELQKLNLYFMNNRVGLIARDQIGNLNLQITRQLHETNGIDLYVWTTARDERVRGNPAGKYPRYIPSHWMMEGKVCKWNNSGVYLFNGEWVQRTVKMPIAMPGEEIACRCVALPYVADLIEEADSMIEEGL